MMKYADSLLKAHPNLIKYKIYPNYKEWTESYGMLNYVRDILGIRELSNHHSIVSVGDGHKPRTAALFATNSCWECVSVDPNLKIKKYPFKRLTLCRSKIEDLRLQCDIAVMVHAHVKPSIVIESTPNLKHLFMMPCCVDIDVPYDTKKIDSNITSPHNIIYYTKL